MNLICFSNNTAGGLLCDLLNGNRVQLEDYKTIGHAHSLMKIGDSPDIQTSIDHNEWNKRIGLYKNYTFWAGTHCHPIGIPDLSVFDQIICITTEHRQSKLLRWLRYFQGWYKHTHPDFQENDSLETIDKIRELCKNVMISYNAHPTCINVEFYKIVNGDFVRELGLNEKEFKKWQDKNHFLYTHSVNDWAVKRFNEAEYEVVNQTSFRYF